MQLFWQTFEGADGVIGDAEGNLLVAERKANRISKIDKNDKITSILTDTNEAGALAIDSKGQINRYRAEKIRSAFGFWLPARKVLADSCNGKKLEGMRDLTVAKSGGIYFTDGRTSTKGSFISLHRPRRARVTPAARSKT